MVGGLGGQGCPVGSSPEPEKLPANDIQGLHVQVFVYTPAPKARRATTAWTRQAGVNSVDKAGTRQQRGQGRQASTAWTRQARVNSVDKAGRRQQRGQGRHASTLVLALLVETNCLALLLPHLFFPLVLTLLILFLFPFSLFLRPAPVLQIVDNSLTPGMGCPRIFFLPWSAIIALPVPNLRLPLPTWPR
ncbi:hypothetical protein IAQ61_000656 [Plenodomus lingam]|uniref:uncharacterized protein n=1 Tax=Leptosphaeria maculans TaxID=5022 RepID=UPI0033233061|nr:hypothetical protein IAQ61_000656 [Plenodomus lingam]